MPIITSVLKNVLNATIGDLLHPPGTDDSDAMVCIAQNKIPKYDKDGKIYCEIPKIPVPDTPRIDPAPAVSTPPTYIYRDRYVRVPSDPTVIYVPKPYDPPKIPERRLNYKQPVDTVSTQTTPGKTIKVNYTLDSLSYGALLHEPISYEPLKIRVCIQDNFEDKFKEKQNKIALNYFRAIGATEETEETKKEPIKKEITDLAVALLSRHFQSFSPSSTKVAPIFGTVGIAELINHYLNKGYANFTPISTIPVGWQVQNICEGVVYPDDEEQINDLLKLIKVSASKSNNGKDDDKEDDFPITVPASILTKRDAQNNIIPTPTIELKSTPQLIVWFFQRFDEILGQFEIPIEIKDTDPSTPGDQSKMMKFPNVAETLAEVMMLLMQLTINSELHTNIVTRILTETGQDKKQNFITYKSVESIIDFLGYKIKNKEVKLPMMFTPDKDGFDEILKECDLPVSVAEYDEKLTLQADLMRFRETAAMVKANSFVKLNPNQDIKDQIMKRLKGFKGLLEDSTSEASADDFDEFLNAVEQGFTNTAGVGDPTKPYGRDYEDRPRIRRIKKVDANDPG